MRSRRSYEFVLKLSADIGGKLDCWREEQIFGGKMILDGGKDPRGCNVDLSACRMQRPAR
jgi:hypothetical protein